MEGNLFIIEGGDGSGKATQTAMLEERLRREGYDVCAVSFPDYDSDAANPYAASTFYAVDRFASYQRRWKSILDRGGIVIADRYTTSNMLYQMIKFDDPAARRAYLDWLEDLEYRKMGLPEPKQVFLLDVPFAVTARLMAQRTGKTGGATGDIHGTGGIVLPVQTKKTCAACNLYMRNCTMLSERISDAMMSIYFAPFFSYNRKD